MKEQELTLLHKLDCKCRTIGAH